MKKYIKDSRGYFDFIKRYKDKYNILIVKPLKHSIKVEYERKLS